MALLISLLDLFKSVLYIALVHSLFSKLILNPVKLSLCFILKDYSEKWDKNVSPSPLRARKCYRDGWKSDNYKKSNNIAKILHNLGAPILFSSTVIWAVWKDWDFPRQRGSPQKRDFVIEKQIARHLCNTMNVFQTTLPFYATQMINPFLNLRISANHDKG